MIRRFIFPWLPSRSPPLTHIALTLLLAWLAAQLCLVLGAPLPWMIGPLLASAVLAMTGGPAASWTPFRNAGQWVIAVALGLYFTPQVVTLIAGLWWAIALNIAWALALGLGFGYWLHWLHADSPDAPAQPKAGWRRRFRVAGLNRHTTYFAGPIGAASEMTLMAERYGARTDLVASSHALRVLLVTLIIPFGFQWAGLHGLDVSPRAAAAVDWPGLGLLALLTGLGCGAMLLLGRTNPWFVGALAVSVLLTANRVNLSALPQPLVNAAQLVIGVSLGVRFTREFVHLAPRWLASVALASIVMLLLCAGFAGVLSKIAGLHWATMLLATSPGGIAEMAITAKVLQLGVPLVTAFHVTRLAGVLLLAEPVYRWFFRQSSD
jgi:uncharacterized protein